MALLTMHIFRVGHKAVVLQEVSHWWVPEDASPGRALIVVMRNGKHVCFTAKDTPNGDDGYAIEKAFMNFIISVGKQ